MESCSSVLPSATLSEASPFPFEANPGSLLISHWHTSILSIPTSLNEKGKDWLVLPAAFSDYFLSTNSCLLWTIEQCAHFSLQMSQFIVQCLNPYRKPDCKVGRITTTEDFKHLARKVFPCLWSDNVLGRLLSEKAPFIVKSAFSLPDAQGGDPGTGREG